MVSRSAYAQLQYSPLLLAGTVAGLGADLSGAGRCWRCSRPARRRILGLAAWVLMALAFQPILRFYRVSPLWGLALPVIAHAYMVFTLDSAYQHARGRGGMWKGRAQADPGTATRRMTRRQRQLRSGKGHRDENFPVASLADPSAPSRRRSWRSTNFVRTADDIADHATLDAGREARAARPARGGPRSATSDERCRRRSRLRTALAERGLSPRHAQDLLDRVPARCHQAALSRLGRSDRLLPLLGHAGRPLRARRARREPRRPGRPTMRCARRCRSSIICRIAKPTTAISTASISRSTLLAARGIGVEALGEPQASPPLLCGIA